MKALPNRFYATAGLGLVAWVQAGAATNLVDLYEALGGDSFTLVPAA